MLLSRFKFNLLIIILLQLSCATSSASQSISAIVNQEIITNIDLDNEIKFVKLSLSPEALNEISAKELRTEALQSMINKILMLDLAKQYKINVSPAEVETQIQAQVQRAKSDLPSLVQFYAEQGITMPQLKQSIKTDLILHHLKELELNKDLKIDEDELMAYLHSPEYAEARQDEYQLRHILLPENLSMQKKFLKELKDGQHFALLATKYSTAENAKLGGDLGFLSLQKLPSLFVDLVPSLSINEIKGPIKHGTNQHWIQLVAKKSNAYKSEVYYQYQKITVDVPKLSLSNPWSNLSRAQVIQNKEKFVVAKQVYHRRLVNVPWLASSALPNEDLMILKTLLPGELSAAQVSANNTSAKYYYLQAREIRKIAKDEFRSFVIQQLSQKKMHDRFVSWLEKLRQKAYIKVIND